MGMEPTTTTSPCRMLVRLPWELARPLVLALTLWPSIPRAQYPADSTLQRPSTAGSCRGFLVRRPWAATLWRSTSPRRVRLLARPRLSEALPPPPMEPTTTTSPFRMLARPPWELALLPVLVPTLCPGKLRDPSRARSTMPLPSTAGSCRRATTTASQRPIQSRITSPRRVRLLAQPRLSEALPPLPMEPTTTTSPFRMLVRLPWELAPPLVLAPTLWPSTPRAPSPAGSTLQRPSTAGSCFHNLLMMPSSLHSIAVLRDLESNAFKS